MPKGAAKIEANTYDRFPPIAVIGTSFTKPGPTEGLSQLKLLSVLAAPTIGVAFWGE
jgi:hypothetical protein